MLIEPNIRTADEIARLGLDRLVTQIEPTLPPTDRGRFICVDVDTGEYEVADDDLAAIDGLLARRPGAETYLGRIGEDATFRLGPR